MLGPTYQYIAEYIRNIVNLALYFSLGRGDREGSILQTFCRERSQIQ